MLGKNWMNCFLVWTLPKCSYRRLIKRARKGLFFERWHRESLVWNLQCCCHHCHDLWKWNNSWNSGLKIETIQLPLIILPSCSSHQIIHNMLCTFLVPQATLAPPVKGKMFKGLSVCYTVLIVTFFSVAISGYWAFGNQSEGLILSNFVDNGRPLVPKWFIYMTNIFTIAQLSAVGVVSNTITLLSPS